jgi:hypothetical protein
MSQLNLTICKIPNLQEAFTYEAYCNSDDLAQLTSSPSHFEILNPQTNISHIFKINPTNDISPGKIGINAPSRKYMNVKINDLIVAKPVLSST